MEISTTVEMLSRSLKISQEVVKPGMEAQLPNPFSPFIFKPLNPGCTMESHNREGLFKNHFLLKLNQSQWELGPGIGNFKAPPGDFKVCHGLRTTVHLAEALKIPKEETWPTPHTMVGGPLNPQLRPLE